jgi:hypothetical protein
MLQTRFDLTQKDIPAQWYNLAAYEAYFDGQLQDV